MEAEGNGSTQEVWIPSCVYVLVNIHVEGHANAEKQKVEEEKKKNEKRIDKTLKTNPLALDFFEDALFCEV